MRDILKLHSGTQSGTGISSQKIGIFGGFSWSGRNFEEISFLEKNLQKEIFLQKEVI